MTRRDYARIALAGVRLFNGGTALVAPGPFARRLGTEADAHGPAVHVARMFGIRTVLIALDLLSRDQDVRQARAARRADRPRLRHDLGGRRGTVEAAAAAPGHPGDGRLGGERRARGDRERGRAQALVTAEKMHADEVDTDAALVRRLLAEQFPQWTDLPIKPARPSGTDNALYRLGDDMVVRLPRRARTGGTLEKERRWLPRLAPLLPLAVPVPLAEGVPAEGYPFAWSVYRWLEGETATVARITDLSRLATDLAQFVAALQRIDPTGGPSPGEHNFFRGVPLTRRDEATRAAVAALGQAIDGDAVTAAWEAALRAPEWERQPVWVHGDLDSRNLLVERGRLCAVIDFGGLGVGDPACDVMVAWKVLSADTRDIFRTALSVDEATWARSRGWALSQALIALAYYTLETNPVLVREAERWLAEVLADRCE